MNLNSLAPALDPVLVVAAVLPILLILLLVAGLRWSAARAGVTAWMVTLALGLLIFRASLPLIVTSQAKALFMALDVLYIVWGALLFHRVCEEAGVVKALGDWIGGSLPSESLRVLAVAWVFASFLQGAGGFGVPVVITAPLLMGMGFAPLEAVLLPAVGHAWAVTFGSLGTSFQALMTASRLSAAALGPDAALLLGACCLACGLLVGRIALRGAEFRRAIPVILLLALVMGGVQYLLVVSGLWQIGSLGGGLAGLGIVFLLGRFGRKAGVSAAPEPAGKIRAGLAAYGLLVGIILAVRWIAPLRAILGAGALKASFPEVANGVGMTIPAEDSAAIAPFAHAGALLLYSAAAAYCLFSFMKLARPGAPRRILDRLVRSAAPVSLGILFLIGVSTLMSHAGMTGRIAGGLGGVIGPAYPVFSPFLGALGAFISGSNANSNLLFAPLQQKLAGYLGLPERVLLAAQTGGGAVGSVLSPAKVTVGAGYSGGAVSEGEIIRKLLPLVLLLLVVLSLGTILLVVLQ